MGFLLKICWSIELGLDRDNKETLQEYLQASFYCEWMIEKIPNDLKRKQILNMHKMSVTITTQ